MLVRALSALMVLWFLAAMQLGAHVHRHDQGSATAHSHVVSLLNDTDHAAAHMQGSVDDESDASMTRVPPAIVLLCMAVALFLVARRGPAAPPVVRDSHDTGPPPHWRPPSQAPPFISSIA